MEEAVAVIFLFWILLESIAWGARRPDKKDDYD